MGWFNDRTWGSGDCYNLLGLGCQRVAREEKVQVLCITLGSCQLVSSHSPLYGVSHKVHVLHDGLQNFDAHIGQTADSRRTLDQPPCTTTKTDESEDRLTVGTSDLTALLHDDIPE